MTSDQISTERRLVVIRHHYDRQPQAAAVLAPAGLDVRRASVHVEYSAEEWFGMNTILHNDTIAAALVRFYACIPAVAPEDAYDRDWKEDGIVDMYWHRDYHWEGSEGIIDDDTLRREGLREFLKALGPQGGIHVECSGDVQEDEYPPIVRMPLRAPEARYAGKQPVHPVSIDDMPAIRLLTFGNSHYTLEDARDTHDLLARLAAELREQQGGRRISLADDRSGDHVWEGVRLEFKTDAEDLRQWDGVPDRIVFDNGPAAGGLATLELMLRRTRKRSRMPSAWLRIDAPANDPRLPRHGDTIQERMDKAAATLDLFAGIAARMQVGEETLDPDALRIALATPHAPWKAKEPEWVKVMSSSDIADGYAHDWWNREWHATTPEPQPSLSFSAACTFRDRSGRPVEVQLMAEPRTHFVHLRDIDEDMRSKVTTLPSRMACP